jgi:flagellar hook assembly protein FlgD
VKIRVFDMLGREIRTLAEGWFEAGTHSVTWDATDNAGRPVVSGVYFTQMQSSEGVQINRMTLMR